VVVCRLGREGLRDREGGQEGKRKGLRGCGRGCGNSGSGERGWEQRVVGGCVGGKAGYGSFGEGEVCYVFFFSLFNICLKEYLIFFFFLMNLQRNISFFFNEF
jgi:hypothetical protein